MASRVTRRSFLRGAGTSVAAASVAGVALTQEALAAPRKRIRIVGVCCSPRKGKTTAAAMQVCLKAAEDAAANVDVELVELAGMQIHGSRAAGLPLESGQRDDFPSVARKLSDPTVAGIIVGTPVYFANMTSLCKAFLDRCGIFRKKNFALSDKVGGCLAVGGVRNGGQELAIQSVLMALLCQEMIIVGDGRPTAHMGATLWNTGKEGVSRDTFGLSTARNLGRRVAEVALKIAASSG